MLGYVGLFAGLALLIWFALRGVNIFLASIVCALVVAIPNGILLPAALLEHYPFGPLGPSSVKPWPPVRRPRALQWLSPAGWG